MSSIFSLCSSLDMSASRLNKPRTASGTDAVCLQRRMLPLPNGCTQTACEEQSRAHANPSQCLGEWHSFSVWANDIYMTWARSVPGNLWTISWSNWFSAPGNAHWCYLIHFSAGCLYISTFLTGNDQQDAFVSKAPGSGVYLLCPQAKYFHSYKSIISTTSIIKHYRTRLVQENGVDDQDKTLPSVGSLPRKAKW